MAGQDLVQAALFEHRFWLQILGDHSRFIFNALSTTETTALARAQYFINAFDSLLEVARQNLNETQVSELTKQSQIFAEELRAFKLELLRRHLAETIQVQLPPTFLNHMVNEVEEYIRINRGLQANQHSRMHPVHHHILWLLDAAGHAASIMSNLDMVEKKLIQVSREFEKNFEASYLKAVEMAGYLRTGLKQFPALGRFNNEAEQEIVRFSAFLEEIKRLEIEKKLLGTIDPLMPDHMLREECYYLTKLAQVSQIKKPNCDPTKPRITV